MTVEYKVEIDCDVIVSELITRWVMGSKNDVIYQLKTDHAALTALFIVSGFSDGFLSEGDLNEITNRLIESRVEIALAGIDN